LELLPGGKSLSKLITSLPIGRHLISIVYAGFARGHNGSSCRYPRPIARTHLAPSKPSSSGPPLAGPSRSTYLVTGMIGGLLGSLAMGLAVHIPDALCVRLATAIAGSSPSAYPLAWGFHILTAVLIGSLFGLLGISFQIGSHRPLARSLLLGLATGPVVWAVFFSPLMLTFLPSMVSRNLLEASLAAHVLLGLVLGATLAVTLWVRPARHANA
jgi:hypothetical protein